MTHRNVLLGIGIFMLIITTMVMFLIPAALIEPLDGTQKLILATIAIAGYGGGALYIYVAKNWD